MRRLIALVVLGISGCAAIGSPPGGPERATPPELLRVTPESGAVNARARAVTFEFDVVVNDRSGGQDGLERLFVVSPTDGDPRVDWHRSRIEVRPRRGFRPNTAYAVTMLPGIADLRGNVLRTSHTIVFSTGPTIPQFAIHGRAFDWLAERVAPGALVEAVRHPDSLRYVSTADSSGQFTVAPLEEGTYTLRVIVDANRDREADRGEPWDSAVVTVRGTSPFLEMLAAVRDTIAPRLLTVTARDTLSISATFDRPLDPDVPLTPASFRVTGADSVRHRIARVLTRAQADSEAARAVRDTARRDTAVRADTARARRPVGRGGMPAVAPGRDIKPSRPAPPKEVIIRLDSLTPLRSGASYRVAAVNARGLLGRVGTSERVLSVPRARADTGRTTPANPAPPTRRP